MNFGPNGGLVYCMEYLIDNLDEFMNEINPLSEEIYRYLNFDQLPEYLSDAKKAEISAVNIVS